MPFPHFQYKRRLTTLCQLIDRLFNQRNLSCATVAQGLMMRSNPCSVLMILYSHGSNVFFPRRWQFLMSLGDRKSTSEKSEGGKKSRLQDGRRLCRSALNTTKWKVTTIKYLEPQRKDAHVFHSETWERKNGRPPQQSLSIQGKRQQDPSNNEYK